MICQMLTWCSSLAKMQSIYIMSCHLWPEVMMQPWWMWRLRNIPEDSFRISFLFNTTKSFCWAQNWFMEEKLFNLNKDIFQEPFGTFKLVFSSRQPSSDCQINRNGLEILSTFPYFPAERTFSELFSVFTRCSSCSLPLSFILVVFIFSPIHLMNSKMHILP